MQHCWPWAVQPTANILRQKKAAERIARQRLCLNDEQMSVNRSYYFSITVAPSGISNSKS